LKITYKKNCKLKIFLRKKEIKFDINQDINIDNCRSEYNKIIDSISKNNDNNIHYLTSKIIERNTINHKLFEDLCFIHLLKNFQKKNVEIYTNNISLFLHFEFIAKYTLLTRFCFNILNIKHYIKPYFSILKFFLNNIKFYFLHANKKYSKNLNNNFIIFSTVTESNLFNKKIVNVYDDWFYQHLKKKNYKIRILLNLHKINSRKNFLKNIRSKKNKFIIIHDYLNIKDFFFIFENFYYKRKISLSDKILFFDINVKKNFEHYLKKEDSGIDILYYKFLEKINSDNIKIFLPHENNIVEKAIICGIKRFVPKNRIFGYFKTTNPKNLLNHHYTSQKNFLLTTKPDIFLFNSNKYRKLFKHKYKKIIAYNFPAFNQLYLKHAKSYDVKHATNKVLVLLTGDHEENKYIIELLNKLTDKSINFLFRHHPFYKFNIKKYFKKSNYRCVNNISLTNEIFLRVKIVVTGYSATAVEFAIRKFPIAFVYNKSSIIKNPFDFTGIKNYRLISTSKMLLKFYNNPIIKDYKNNFFNLKLKIPKII
jgi:hypothetical protein